jgi:hypothetical protein
MFRHCFKLLGVSLIAGTTIFAACSVQSTGGDSDDNTSEWLDGTNGNTPGAGSGSGAGSATGTGSGSGSGSGSTGSGTQPDNSLGLGDACNCDSECQAVDNHEGVCVYGVCMTKASADCSAGGSTAECPAGAQCWSIQNVAGSLCIPECAGISCAGGCDSDGLCLPTENTSCDYGCGYACSCTDGDCADGEQCIAGACQPAVDVGDPPGPGPGPTCSNLPQPDCTGGAAYCGELIAFNPRTTPHYDDYPLNGETSANQYRSFLRRDFTMLLDYATAKTYCKSQGWTTGIGGALGFGDMSEALGEIPGTAVGQPGHPQGTHVDGHDIDLAYYQIGQPNNYLRPICEHTLNGADQYHCTSAPHILDVWRTALFLGITHESNTLRVIGVDGAAGTMITSAMQQLCNDGWLDPSACSNMKLAYEVTDMGYGWYRFHHHHAHISTCGGPCANLLDGPSAMQPMLPGMDFMPVKRHPYPFGIPAL